MPNMVEAKKQSGTFDYLQVFILDEDKPTTCPHCSAGTDNKISDDTLICFCSSCDFTFRGELP